MKSFLSYFFVVSLMTPVAFAQVPYYYLTAQVDGGPPGGGMGPGPGMMMGGPGMGMPMEFELKQLKKMQKTVAKYPVLLEVVNNFIEMIEAMRELMGGGEDEYEEVILEPDIEGMREDLASIVADKAKLAQEKAGLSSLSKAEAKKKRAFIVSLEKMAKRGEKELTQAIAMVEEHESFEGEMEQQMTQADTMRKEMMQQGKTMAKQRMEQEMSRGKEMMERGMAQQGGGPGGPGGGFMGGGQFTGGMGPMGGGPMMGGFGGGFPGGGFPGMPGGFPGGQGGDHGPGGFPFPGQGYGPGGYGQGPSLNNFAGGQFPGMGMPMPMMGPQQPGVPAPEASGGTQGSIYRIYKDYLRARWQ